MLMFRRFISCLLLLTGIIFSCTSCANRSTIANGLPAREANEVVVLLVSKGIFAEKIPVVASSVGGASSEQLWDVAVPGNQITEALAVLNQAGLPRPKGTSLLDLFAKQGLVPSELQEKIRYQEGLSEQMATTIRKMDGIIDANVQISFSSQECEEEIPMTASVYIKHRGVLDNPNSIVVTKIKRLVASAVPGLSIENVSVIGDRAVYNEINLTNPWGDDTTLVSIWGMILSKGSVVKFRAIFYAAMLLLFITFSIIAWLFWKIHLLIPGFGGVNSFVHVTPYHYEKGTANTDKKEDPKAAKDASKDEDKKEDEDHTNPEKPAEKDEEAATNEENVDTPPKGN